MPRLERGEGGVSKKGVSRRNILVHKQRERGGKKIFCFFWGGGGNENWGKFSVRLGVGGRENYFLNSAGGGGLHQFWLKGGDKKRAGL